MKLVSATSAPYTGVLENQDWKTTSPDVHIEIAFNNNVQLYEAIFRGMKWQE
jgi:hypothetical protein